MSAILFDLDGVLYEGETAIKGAAETIAWFSNRRIPYFFLTNTTSKPRSALVDKLAHFGIASRVEQFLTPPLAAVQLLLKAELKRLALFVPAVTQTEFDGFEIIENDKEPVDAIILGDLAADWNFSRLNRCFRLLMQNPDASLIALGMTRYWKSDGQLQLDVGPFVKALEYATGRTAIVTGKPAASFYRAATSLLASHSIIYMIGDDIIADIEAAQQTGLKTLLVRTGKFKAADLESGIVADAVIDSISELPNWWLANVPESN